MGTMVEYSLITNFGCAIIQTKHDSFGQKNVQQLLLHHFCTRIHTCFLGSWVEGGRGGRRVLERQDLQGLRNISPQFTVKVLQSLSPRDATAPAPAGGSPRPAPPTGREGGHRFAASHYFRTQSR
jgi:hypothetical protein